MNHFHLKLIKTPRASVSFYNASRWLFQNILNSLFQSCIHISRGNLLITPFTYLFSSKPHAFPSHSAITSMNAFSTSDLSPAPGLDWSHTRSHLFFNIGGLTLPSVVCQVSFSSIMFIFIYFFFLIFPRAYHFTNYWFCSEVYCFDSEAYFKDALIFTYESASFVCLVANKRPPRTASPWAMASQSRNVPLCLSCTQITGSFFYYYFLRNKQQRYIQRS